MKNKWIWISLIIITLISGTFYFRRNISQMIRGQSRASNTAQAQGGNVSATGVISTTTIRSAVDSSQVSAAGNIEIANQLSAIVQVEGVIMEVSVAVGDEVSAGDLLVSLATADLQRAVQRAELDIATQQTLGDKLLEPSSAADIASDRANLVSAKENLAEVQAGPTETELAAAETALSAAQAAYQELLDGPSEAELTQLSLDLHKITITLQQAQEAYDAISYRGDIGSTSQATDLQEATLDYESAKAAYEIATEPASTAELQNALKSIQDAQHTLETLRNQPTAAELAEAEAKVSEAEANLAQLLDGPSVSELREAEINLEQAQLDLEEAEADLAETRLRAPIAGTILTVDVETGQKVSSGFVALALADLSDLELTVNVAEVDISKVEIGQPSIISIDALPDQIFSGAVSLMAPSTEADSGVVNYPITIKLDQASLNGVRPGMTAVATIADEVNETEWLVPTNALQEFEGEISILLMRNGRQVPVTVIPGSSQGEWTIVQSPDLHAGDEVVGEVSSFLAEDEAPRGFGPPRR